MMRGMKDMSRDKFLTVMAVLGENGQSQMEGMQRAIFSCGVQGTQTMNIPFHISLGSFPLEKKEDIINRMQSVSKETRPFSVIFPVYSSFTDRVLFAKPIVTPELLQLHSPFEGNYADGFPWTPHATLFIGAAEETAIARKALDECFQPFSASITALELGSFFPAEFICRCPLNDEA